MKINASTRRQFIRHAATGVGAMTILPRHVFGGPRFVPPSEKVNIALVGAGGMGRSNMGRLLQLEDAQIMAVADPAESYDETGRTYDKPRGLRPTIADVERHYATRTPNFRCAAHSDFRIMLEREKSIDAVLCATPDHLHAHVSAYAMQAGKHVYCEKPLAHDIRETRHLATLARTSGVATQMGNQGQSDEGVRQTIELLHGGAVGTVREIHVWVRSGRYHSELGRWPAAPEPVPGGLDWDLWLGPCEHRPFHSAYAPFTWRDFWDFGGGPLADFLCHDLNPAFWAFDLGTPERVEGSGTDAPHPDLTYSGALVRYDFPAAGQWPALRITWYHGGLKPATPEALGTFPLPNRGALYLGDQGVLLTGASGGAPRLFPESRRASFPKPPRTLPRSGGHHRDWLDACKGGPKAGSHFERAAKLTELAHLGNLALRTGKIIRWDPADMRAAGVPAAAALVGRSYRAGWELT